MGAHDKINVAWLNACFGEVVQERAASFMPGLAGRAVFIIAAAEIEAWLQTHPAVAGVAVTAVTDELRDEEVMACIVTNEGFAACDELAENLFTFCAENLAYYKAPGWLLFMAELPTTGTQKIQKHRLFAPGADPREQAGINDFRDRKRRQTV